MSGHEPIRELLLRQIRMLGFIHRAHYPEVWTDITDYTDKDYEATLRARALPRRGKSNGYGVLGIAKLRREPRA